MDAYQLAFDFRGVPVKGDYTWTHDDSGGWLSLAVSIPEDEASDIDDWDDATYFCDKLTGSYDSWRDAKSRLIEAGVNVYNL